MSSSVSYFLNNARNQPPYKFLRLLRNFFDKILFPCDEYPFAEILNKGLKEELSILGESNISDLIFDGFSMRPDLIFDFFADSGQDGRRDGEVLGREGEDGRKYVEYFLGQRMHF